MRCAYPPYEVHRYFGLRFLPLVAVPLRQSRLFAFRLSDIHLPDSFRFSYPDSTRIADALVFQARQTGGR